MLDMILHFFANYLIEVMSGVLVLGLILRWSLYKSSKKDYTYFLSFTREIDKVLNHDKSKRRKIDDVDQYLAELLDKVSDKLPNRSLRNDRSKKSASKGTGPEVVSLREYVSGNQGFFRSIKSENSAFKSNFPPDFDQITDRILSQEKSWTKLYSFFPIDSGGRLIGTLPGIFIVLGIFGTFLGISMALPEIAQIDFSNVESSGEILTRFVLNVTFAMKTSIAGILFSLVMTLLNTMAPVKSLRDKTTKSMTSTFENIWFTIHGDQGLEQEMKEYLPQMLEELKVISSDKKNQRKGA